MSRQSLRATGRTLLVLAASAGWGCGLLSRTASPPPARAVVLVLAGGLEPGVDLTRTPALERLRQRGRSFESAFALDPEPAAARGALLRPGPLVLAELFRKQGAKVAAVGPGEEFGVDPGAVDLRLVEPLESGHSMEPLEAWLRREPGRVLVLVTIGAHLDAPPHPVAAGSGISPPLPRIAADHLGFAGRSGETVRPPVWSETSRQRAAAVRLERAVAADRALDGLLALVERAAPESAVVLVGDPPIDGGRHGIVTRPGLFDDTLRSTLIVTTPGMSRPGRPSNRLVSTRDVPATLLDLAGLPPEPTLEGGSLGPLVSNPSADWTEEVLSSVARTAPGIGRTARSERWRYTEWPDGSRELYDHASDPGENANLAWRPEHRPTVETMRRALERSPASGRPADRPLPGRRDVGRASNVLLVIFDDLNTRVGAWGAAVRTPNIDRLAARGVRFDLAYAPVAMCNPSRVSLLTGWSPERTGVWNNVDWSRPRGAVPLQEHFAAHGAITAAIGKVQHYPEASRWDLLEHRPQLAEDERDASGAADDGEPFVAAPGEDRDQPDSARALRAVRFLERRGRRSFFLALGIVHPHTPWIAPARYFDLYPPASIAPLPYPVDDLADVPAIAVKTRPQPLPGLPLLGREPAGLVTDPVRRQAIRSYQACTSFADAQLGLVLDALDRLDLWRDTAVVLVSDNGYHLGEHGGLLRKDTLFEEALRVPLIVAAPGLRPAVVRTPVELADVYPTIVELAGLPAVPGLDARSLVPQLVDAATASRGPARSYRLVRPPERAWSIRTTRLRYTLWPDGSEELYEVSAPAAENLADRPERAAERAVLRARLEALVVPSVAGER